MKIRIHCIHFDVLITKKDIIELKKYLFSILLIYDNTYYYAYLDLHLQITIKNYFPLLLK